MCTAILLLACWLAQAGQQADYRAAIERWRQQREAQLKSEDGWTTVIGLFWLEPGANRVGSAADSEVLLPGDAAPARVGVISLQGQRVRLEVAERAQVLVNGRPVRSAELHSDADANPDVVAVGRLKLLLLKRGPRYAIRLKDPESPFRKNFKGLRWYPVSEQWRIAARFLPYPSPRKVVLQTIVGIPDEMQSPGEAEFEREGKRFRLQALQSGNQLFFVFRDATAGKTTYQGGRFLYADLPREGKVILDFNKAFNPPCAFTPYATCPLPPAQNRLPIAITAGEMTYPGSPH